MGRHSTLEDWIGFGELKEAQFYQGILAEFVGTLFLVLIGCGVATISTNTTHIALAFGAALASLVWITGHVSGGHLNPAVSVSMLVTRHVSLVRAFVYVLVQMVGAITGAGILFGLLPETMHKALGNTSVNAALTSSQGFGVEFMITFMFVTVIFAVTDDRRKDVGAGCAPMAIGLALFTGHLFAISLTGSSMNPARSFGPAVVMGGEYWNSHWIYWLGPPMGALAAGVFYDYTLKPTDKMNAVGDIPM